MLHRNCPLIYVVDDDADDTYVLSVLFEENHKDCTVRFLKDGSDLMIRLTHSLDGRLPDLILLDLHMPILSGKEILQLLACDEQLRSIPVAVMSGSDEESVVKYCFQLGAAAFISKIKSYPQLVQAVDGLMKQCLFSTAD
ncbi:response regulator receiver protein [Fibrisoma limi BUZ 3]|uniref:Response regulator receiver protein n=1 Tax=Fibrisoma limi BUZ 3 TaxID=1185876 RepID=I2GNJ4_9BACT|nr:response regulator [Fibrisoma limi]CCH55472.1 response regulator receiver protein [Fibrisoma limi BUZ 3]